MTKAMRWDRTPLTQELVDHTRALIEASRNAHLIARLAGVQPNALHSLINRRYAGVAISTMEALFDLRVEDFDWQVDLELVRKLERIRDTATGTSYARKSIPPVAFPFREKDRYAAHLYTVRNWTKTDISRVLRMSGSRVTLAIGKCS